MRISDWSSDVCSSDLKMQFTYNIANTQRAIGTKLSSKLVRKYGMSGLQPGHITVRLRGSAGQSLGAFAVQGLKIEVFGAANDYVGNGLSGGTIAVRPQKAAALASPENTRLRKPVPYTSEERRVRKKCARTRQTPW